MNEALRPTPRLAPRKARGVQALSRVDLAGDREGDPRGRHPQLLDLPLSRPALRLLRIHGAGHGVRGPDEDPGGRAPHARVVGRHGADAGAARGPQAGGMVDGHGGGLPSRIVRTLRPRGSASPPPVRRTGEMPSRPRAKCIASSTARHFSGPRLATRSRNTDLATVTMVSRLMTHSLGMPSRTPRGTSAGIPRIRVVTGATVTSARTAYASSRDSSRTGRRPAGAGRSAHHTSPRVTPRAPRPEWRGSPRERRPLPAPVPAAPCNPGRNALRPPAHAVPSGRTPRRGGRTGCAFPCAPSVHVPQPRAGLRAD